MAILHRAEIRPGKLELLSGWLPGRPWYRGPAGVDLKRVDAYRFDDPAGEVGIETLLVDAGDGQVLQIPLTYRGAPLAGGDEWLVGTMEHSVLGTRWVYQGCGDPVYLAALARAVLTGAGQAEELFEIDGRMEARAPSCAVHGNGEPGAFVPDPGSIHHVDDSDPTVVVTETLRFVIFRAPGVASGSDTALVGTWPGQPTEVVLAEVALRTP